MNTLNFTNAQKIAEIESSTLLRALSSKDFLSNPKNKETLKEIHSAEEEVDNAGDIGLTVKFDEIKPLVSGEGRFAEWFGAKGEFYIITTAFDGSGNNFEYKTKYFQGIPRNTSLPLGDGGLLVAYLKNPKWFVDIHMIIMESDSDYRKLGESIEKAKKESKLGDAMKFVGSLSTIDPTSISKVISAVDIFTDLVAYFMKENGDDHIATIHDFYLKHQAFGQGRHPKEGLKNFINVDAAYSIDLTPLK
jgi:hypothetical protein